MIGGELLVEMRDNGQRVGPHGGAAKSGSAKELDSFGISKKESHEAQQLAGSPPCDGAAIGGLWRVTLR